jgi:ABC-type multidrug transport system fused ATPase/permease subunit
MAIVPVRQFWQMRRGAGRRAMPVTQPLVSEAQEPRGSKRHSAGKRDGAGPNRTEFRFKTICGIYKNFWPHLRRYWAYFALAYAALIGVVVMNLLKPWPLKLIFDYILLNKPLPDSVMYLSAAPSIDTLALLTIFCIGIVVVVFFAGMFSYTRSYFMASAGERVLNDVRRQIFDHIQVLSQASYATAKSGDLILRLTSDIKSLKKILIKSTETLATYILTFIGIIATMLWIDWQLTLIALVVIPPLYLLAAGAMGKVESLTRTQRTKEGEVASIVQETMMSMPVVQAFTQESRERSRFRKAGDESLMAEIKKLKVTRVFGRAVHVIMAIGTALVVWYAAKRVLGGSLTPGDVIVFTAYLKDLYKPVGGMSELIMDLSGSLVCAQRVAEVLEIDAAVKDAPDAVPAPQFRGEVSFVNLTFGYKSDEPVLRGVSFIVQPGQMVALIGSSGTGKSTVVNLLLRFFDPWEGQILVDGHDIRRFTLESYRRQMSVVLQKTVLFRSTIGENIAYGRPEATLEEIIEAAQAAQAHDFIVKLPDGYETVLDERGEGLSGGQMQRIALARAILKDAPILILDEPVNALDAVTEERINNTITSFMKTKTTFLIAHKLATVKRADLILVIEEGKVLAHGTHDELCSNSGAYRDFNEVQYEQAG